jgi:hypothetical protein
MLTMSTSKVKYSREYWLQRAEEMRSLAELMTNPDTIQKMLGVAETYEQLAKHAPDEAPQADPPKDQLRKAKL